VRAAGRKGRWRPACTGHGHMWPPANTQAFNAWAPGRLTGHYPQG
jgi:hypothetical protein